ncbi:MAG: GspE/PulE family protein [Planctomycetota bacterium]
MTSAPTAEATILPTAAPAADAPPCTEFISRVPYDFARRHLLLGLRSGPETAPRLLTAEGTDPFAVHNTRTLLGWGDASIESVGAEALATRIDRAYEDSAHAAPCDADDAGSSPEDLDRLLAEADRDLLTTEGKAPVVRLVDGLLFEALRRRASDLHIQPLADRTVVRVRVDGSLHDLRELPPGLTAAVTSRIKVMGHMDIAERRIPQDGRATVTIGDASAAGRAVDLRLSTLPTSYGERVVIRLLDTSDGVALTDLDALGMPPDVASAYRRITSRPNGVVLLTGPTGSGKTTTLYATLRWIAARGDGELNVMTVEDPIEYELSTAGVAISQAQVNTRKGVTFASGLRHILRQDPDVVMVGEIRDAETARIAIQASLTGHLVFSTLHTNDAASAVTRLVDLGVEPYLVAASLSAVVAQRLVRRVHAECSGRGCEACMGTGFRGRLPLFELLEIDEGLREGIASGETCASLREGARAHGMRTLYEDGLDRVSSGLTTREEVARVTVDLGGAETGDG